MGSEKNIIHQENQKDSTEVKPCRRRAASAGPRGYPRNHRWSVSNCDRYHLR